MRSQLHVFVTHQETETKYSGSISHRDISGMLGQLHVLVTPQWKFASPHAARQHSLGSACARFWSLASCV